MVDELTQMASQKVDLSFTTVEYQADKCFGWFLHGFVNFTDFDYALLIGEKWSDAFDFLIELDDNPDVVADLLINLYKRQQPLCQGDLQSASRFES